MMSLFTKCFLLPIALVVLCHFNGVRADLMTLATSGDYESYMQQVDLHSRLELVGEMPWWWTAEDAATNQTRRSMKMETSIDDESDKTKMRLKSHVKTEESDNQHRRTRRRRRRRRRNRNNRLATNALTANKNGYCLPITSSSSTCQGNTKPCGGTRGDCCLGFTCARTSSGRKQCRPKTCLGSGRECSTSSSCCSAQCVSCNGGCQGRCGLGIENERDNIQTFYYPWYANLETDKKFRHWAIAGRGNDNGVYDPLNKDLPSPFYPRLGAYSSSSSETLKLHMKWIRRAGIGTIIVSWWGQGSEEDKLIWKVMNAADDQGIKVGFYIEPYKGGYIKDPSKTNNEGTRTPQTAKEDVKYLINTYGCHRAMYRRGGRPVFMFFAARSYDEGNQKEWAIVWKELYADPKYNPIVIAHDVNLENRIIAGEWSGGHDYGTEAAEDTSDDWPEIAEDYEDAGKIFYFTVSPGFDDTRLSNPDKPIIERNNGKRYEDAWKKAINSKTNNNPVIITSFNEWHEGTQIEPSNATTIKPYTYQGQSRGAFTYKDYEGDWGLKEEAADFAYLDKTKLFSDLYLKKANA
ncbi:hypothetical protein MPSEU_000261200 [Mayamaea pseudoterrestris]|nr:hypothetical protein MPSEU_000261200 [Mayamaea pseudoterrestris]